MNGPPETADDAHERSRAEAEREFYLGYVAWLEALVDEAKRFPIPPKPDVGKIVAEAAAAGFRGDPKPAAAHSRRASPGIVVQLVDLCARYVTAELDAYADFLRRKEATPSQLVTQLERRAEVTLTQTKRRKWTHGLKHISGPFDSEPWIDEAWQFVEDRVQEHLRDSLEPDVWFGTPESEQTVSAEGGFEPSVPSDSQLTSRRDQVDTFLLRCVQETQLKAIRTHLWRAVGHNTPRQFQFWQRNDPRATAADDQNFRRILNMNPTDFVRLLKQKGIIKNSE